MAESDQVKKVSEENQTQTRHPKIILRCSQPKIPKSYSAASEHLSSSIVPRIPVNGSELRCDPDPFHPGLAQCTAQVDDDRQGISHFFGRNKKATASIPQNCFPLMCRIHYQEKGYRWGRDSPGIFADFQCGCIVKTLENMYQLTFIDDEGNTWPWFCGLRLQIPMPKERKPIASKSTGRNEPDDSESVVEQSDKYETALDDMPLWLRSLITKHPRDTRYSPTEHPNGVQYDILQVIAIVRFIGKYCVDNEVKLPKIEAIPITLGMHFEQELDKTKKIVKELTTKRDRATTGLQNAIPIAAREAAGEELELAVDALELAEDDLELAQFDFDATSHMVPATRITKKRVVAINPILETITPVRNKSKTSTISTIESVAAKITLETDEDYTMDEPDNDDEVLIYDSSHTTPPPLVTGHEPAAQTMDLEETESENLEEGEIREYSDDEDISNSSSRRRRDSGIRSSQIAPKKGHSRKRSVGSLDVEVDDGIRYKRLRLTKW